jgi:hypothetical protein
MRFTSRWRDALGVAVILSLVGLGNIGPALAAPAPSPAGPVVAQAATTTAVTGNARDGSGAPVVGARVTLSGPSSTTVSTDGSGNFTATVAPGIYRISISKPGYNPVALSDITIAPGTSTPLTVTMTQADLNSLRTIGSVTSTTRGSSINTGPATQTFLSSAAISNFGAPQISDVLQHVPGITVQQMGSQQDRSIVVGGVQPYETQVLIDGHPLALGQNGVWVSTYFPSALLGGIETQIGPGNTTPFANIAVGGTANLLTPGFTAKPHVTITQSYDNYGSQGTTFLGTGTTGHLGYVVDLTTSGLNSPFTGTTKCIVNPDSGAGQAGTATISNCTSADAQLYQKGEVFKLKYDFSPTTSLEAGFVGAWGGWNPQGTAWGESEGPYTIKECSSNGYQCTNPNGLKYVGQAIPGYFWYQGSAIWNNQDIWDAQFRTAVGNTTILIRPYLGSIEPEITTGGQTQASTPAFFGPNAPIGSATGPSFANGTPLPTGYTPATPAEKACANGGNNLANPQGIYTVVSGQFECFGSAFITYEQDKLYGNTTSIIQPLGNDNLLNFTYDFHGQSTTAVIAFPGNYAVPPGTADRYSTFSLTGTFHVTPRLTANLGLYTTQWSVYGGQPLESNADIVNQFVAALNSGNFQPAQPATVNLNRSVVHGDPHLAFVYRANQDVSIRAAAGSSTTFPFVDQVSGAAQYETPACTLGPPFADGGTLILKNSQLNPETSIGYGLGADVRTKHAGTFSVDLQQTIVHNVFETLTQSVALGPTVPDTCGIGLPALLGVFEPVNVARLNAQSVIFKYAYQPVKGFGFNIAATAESSILSGLGPQFFTPTLPGATPVYSVPANNVQICGNGTTAPGIATCIPYLQGYGQITWAQPDGSFVGLGVNYQGKNNAYFQPPFALVDMVAIRPVSKFADVQLSVQNLLNTNNYGAYLPIPYGSNQEYPGVPLVGNTANATQTAISQGSFYPTVVPATARYVRLMVRVHV